MQANQKFKPGDKIVPVEAIYPNGAMVVVGYEPLGTLLVLPLGGGLEYRFKPEGKSRLMKGVAGTLD